MSVIEFSKFVMPNASGVPTYLYQVKDPVARAAIAGGNKFVFAWKGGGTPDVTKIPNTVTVRYNGTAYTGTLDPAVAHANVPSGFWLVSVDDGGGQDGYEEYFPTEDTDTTPSVWKWERIGFIGMSLSDFGALAYMDGVELDKGQGANVIGENATLQSQDSNVTFDEHTTESALGTGATFSVTGPTLSKTRKRIKSESITPLDGTEPADVALNPTKKKLKRESITPAKAKSIRGSDLATVTKKKLRTNRIYTPDEPQKVPILNGATKRKMETKPFPVTAPANTPETVKGLDIRMYNPSFHGQISGADEETLVLMFGTTPTLTLGENPPARMATGALVQDGDAGTQAHTDYDNETGGEIVNSVNQTRQYMVTGRSDTTVADGKLDDARDGDNDTLIGDIDLDHNVDVAEPDIEKNVATGELAGEGESGYDTTPSGEGNAVVVGASPSVTIPKAGSVKQVLLEEWQNADDNANHINIMTDVEHSGEYNMTVVNPDTVDAITELGDATAAAQSITFANKDLKKVALYDDLKIRTEANPVKRYLNFVMPLGGKISLVKIGSPESVQLEYSFDGVNWTSWTEGSVTIDGTTYTGREMILASDERFYIRSGSTTSADLSESTSNYYKFDFSTKAYAYGNVMSLLCKIPENASLNRFCFAYLFSNTLLVSAPDMPATVGKNGCYHGMYSQCTELEKMAYLPMTVIPNYGYRSLCYGCVKLTELRVAMTDGTANNAITSWLADILTTGKLYIPRGTSIAAENVPSNWTIVYTD